MTREEFIDFVREARKAVNDKKAVAGKELYPTWKAGIYVNVGERYNYCDVLYNVIQAHTTQDDWTPDKVPAMFAAIDVEHAGTFEDPYTWTIPMECHNGKYYKYNGVIYKCIRDSGIPLNYAPDALLQNYFEIAEGE